MKQKIAKLLLVTMLAGVLSGCTLAKCDLCGDTGVCDTVTILGEKVNICNDCQDEISSIF